MSLAFDTRGAIFVETLVVVPLFVVIWVIAWWLHDVNASDMTATEQARSCAWRFAVSGCREVPAGCDVGVIGEVDGAELQAATRGTLGELAGGLPFLAPTLAVEHGHLAIGRGADRVHRPFGPGHTTVSVDRVTMCDTPTGEWTEGRVFEETCKLFVGVWCPL